MEEFEKLVAESFHSELIPAEAAVENDDGEAASRQSTWIREKRPQKKLMSCRAKQRLKPRGHIPIRNTLSVPQLHPKNSHCRQKAFASWLLNAYKKSSLPPAWLLVEKPNN